MPPTYVPSFDLLRFHRPSAGSKGAGARSGQPASGGAAKGGKAGEGEPPVEDTRPWLVKNWMIALPLAFVVSTRAQMPMLAWRLHTCHSCWPGCAPGGGAQEAEINERSEAWRGNGCCRPSGSHKQSRTPGGTRSCNIACPLEQLTFLRCSQPIFVLPGSTACTKTVQKVHNQETVVQAINIAGAVMGPQEAPAPAEPRGPAPVLAGARRR